MKLEFMLSGLNCPNCAAKIEADVRKLPEVKDASLNLMKQILALEVSREEAVFEKVEQIVHRYEPDVKVRLKNEAQEENFDIKGMLIRMAVGAAVFAVGLAAGRFRLWLLIAAYGILG